MSINSIQAKLLKKVIMYKKKIIYLSLFVTIFLGVFFTYFLVRNFPSFVQKRRVPLYVEMKGHIQLQGKVDENENSDFYVIDLFDTSTTTIASLKQRGAYVICYFSAGSSEDWRQDFSRFKEIDMGNTLFDWKGERWLDTRSSNVRGIMVSRIILAKNKGCDGIDPDNVDGYSNNTGIPLTSDTQSNYNIFLANEAHRRGLLIGLKNDILQIPSLVSYFDFAINEQCFFFKECENYRMFINQNKPVFVIEYADMYIHNIGGARDTLCKTANSMNLRALILSKKTR